MHKLTKLTVKWLEHPPVQPQRYDLTVPNMRGLVVRVHPSGVVSFRLRYKRDDRSYVMVLGEYGHKGLSLADVTEMHTQALREIERGLDPIEERARRQQAAEAARRADASAETIEAMVEEFVHRALMAQRRDPATGEWVAIPKSNIKARKRPLAAAALLGYRPKHLPASKNKKPPPSLLSRYGKLRARDLTKRQLIELLNEIVDRGAPVAANRTYALLKQMFTYAAAQDLIPASPMAGIQKPGGEERPRTRRLTPEEIRTVWIKLDSARMTEASRLGLKVLLLTAQRRGELTRAEWSHFDLEEKMWSIPPELQKTEGATKGETKPHQVPLSDLAVQLLTRMKELAKDSPWVLPSPRGKGSLSYAKDGLSRAVKENREHFGIPAWTPHDLRRTAASAMTMLKVPRLHVEKILNHAISDIAEIYDQHDYLDEKREALERWAAYLDAVVKGTEKQIIPMPRRQTA